MARMIFPDERETREFPAIQGKLAEIGITLRDWPAPADARAQALLDKAALSDAEKEELLRAVDNRFETLKQEAGYATRDMIVLHEDVPGLAAMLGKFDNRGNSLFPFLWCVSFVVRPEVGLRCALNSRRLKFRDGRRKNLLYPALLFDDEAEQHRRLQVHRATGHPGLALAAARTLPKLGLEGHDSAER